MRDLFPPLLTQPHFSAVMAHEQENVIKTNIAKTSDKYDDSQDQSQIFFFNSADSVCPSFYCNFPIFQFLILSMES